MHPIARARRCTRRGAGPWPGLNTTMAMRRRCACAASYWWEAGVSGVQEGRCCKTRVQKVGMFAQCAYCVERARPAPHAPAIVTRPWLRQLLVAPKLGGAAPAGSVRMERWRSTTACVEGSADMIAPTYACARLKAPVARMSCGRPPDAPRAPPGGTVSSLGLAAGQHPLP